MAEKQASNYGGKESNGGSKNKENIEKFEKSNHDFWNEYSSKYEDRSYTNCKPLTSFNPSNQYEYYLNPNTGNSSVGTELLKKMDSRKSMDNYGQQCEVAIYQIPNMQAFQYNQQSQYDERSKFQQQNLCMKEIQPKSKSTSYVRSFIDWGNNYFGSPTQPELKQHEVNQESVAKKVHKKLHAIVYKPNFIRERVRQGVELFNLLEKCHTSCEFKIGFISVKYNWTETHLKIERGLNILATCKNIDCTLHLKGIVCPRGRFVDRNGYCTLDMQLFKVICPKCKLSITPDESFGFGFYDCSFELTYKLVNQQEYRTNVEGHSGVFYFGKFCPFMEKFLFLEAQIAILSGLL